MFSAEILPNGRLAIYADNEARAWIKERQQAGNSEYSILWGGFESYWTNGSYHPFDAGEANPFVGLTSAPCIAEEMDTDDDGKNTIVGRLWAFMDYCVISPIEELKCKGRVEFDLVE